MERHPTSAWWGRPAPTGRRWFAHDRHEAIAPPRGIDLDRGPSRRTRALASDLIQLDGSAGEGGGQILRTALSLALLTGRPFRMVKVRANRDRPGLRPQHLAALKAAAELGGADVEGASVGSRELTFRPGPYEARDLAIDIGTAGSTAMVLHTLHLPLALRAGAPVRLTLVGGTFNPKAPSFPFLEATWRGHVARMGLPIALAMPEAGFYPVGGGRLEAWIEPGRPRAITLLDRGPLRRLRGAAGVLNLRHGDIAGRMRDRAATLLAGRGREAEIELVEWSGRGQGAAISLVAEHEHGSSAFVGLGARGKPAERVAEEAVAELLAFLDAEGAVDPHSADQLLLPLAFAEGRSVYTVTEVTEHLRTNLRTVAAFLDRPMRLEEPAGGPARVVVG